MSLELLSTSVTMLNKAIFEKSSNDEDYMVAEFMCFMLNIEFRRSSLIFEKVKVEYIKQSRIIDKIIIESKKMNEIDIIRLFVENKSNFSPFIFAYSERNI